VAACGLRLRRERMHAQMVSDKQTNKTTGLYIQLFSPAVGYRFVCLSGYFEAKCASRAS
jgi:hypothetical protein